ncbi:DUF2254 family protein [Actinomadura sp. 9N407]|uniref:DUF2254 family protein n=1 Tax=Actinomadura sp. 9N407 TaxID=3375154 RepID=UPI0037BA26CB
MRHPVRPTPATEKGGLVKALRALWAFRRALAEFLMMPLLMLAAFTALGAVTVYLDLSTAAPLRRARTALDKLIPSEVAVDLLAQVAPAIVGVASLTFSVLLIAVQQNASLYTPVVFDEFLRRRSNQIHFGFFIGLSLYSFILLASVRPGNHLAFGAVLLFLLTTVALVMLMTLIYGTINQMRPASVLSATWKLTLRSRSRAGGLLAMLREAPLLPPDRAAPVLAPQDGYLVDVRFKRLRRVIGRTGSEVEVVFEHPVGTYLGAGDQVAHVRGEDAQVLPRLASQVAGCLVIDTNRDVRTDPGYAVEQIAGIAWTAYSSSQNSPVIALAAMRVLTDLLERWILGPPPERHGTVPVVYPDVILAETIDRLTKIGRLTEESGNAAPCTEVFLALAQIVPYVRTEYLPLLEDRVWRLLPIVAGLTTLSADIEDAARLLARALSSRDRHRCAEQLDALIDAHQHHMHQRYGMPRPHEADPA